MKPQKRRYRDAEGVDGVGIREGCPPPQPTRGSGKRRELSSRVRGGVSAANAFSALLRVTERSSA